MLNGLQVQETERSIFHIHSQIGIPHVVMLMEQLNSVNELIVLISRLIIRHLPFG
jgi:hypothetical protein